MRDRILFQNTCKNVRGRVKVRSLQYEFVYTTPIVQYIECKMSYDENAVEYVPCMCTPSEEAQISRIIITSNRTRWLILAEDCVVTRQRYVDLLRSIRRKKDNLIE